MQWWALFVIIATLIGFYENITSLFPNSEKEVLKIGRIIEGESYLNWLKEEFESKYQNYEIEYIPKIGALNESAPKRFERLFRNKNVHIFLGGTLELHEQRKHGLGIIDHLIQNSKKNISKYDIGGKWIGYYQKYLGAVWNHKKLDSSFVIRSVLDIENYISTNNILIPNISSSASRDLFIALGLERNKINMEMAKSRYNNLLKNGKSLESGGPEVIRILARIGYDIGVEWPHDAIRLKRLLNYDCISISIFNESIPTISCISVLDDYENKQIVKDFVNFVLSLDAQQKHFDKAFRLPINDSLLKVNLLQLYQIGELRYLPQQLKTNIIKSPNINSFLNSMNERNILELTFDQKESARLPRCQN